MEYSAERGICMFAYNNEQLDYGQFSLLAAKQAKQYLDVPVCLITDNGTWSWLTQNHGEHLVDQFIDEVVITKEEPKQNKRTHYDSPYANFVAQFTNDNKHKIYEYSPYEKTLLIDIDYMIRTNFLDAFWDTPGVGMYNTAKDLNNKPMHMRERLLYDAGIPMWWSTVIMFDRSDISKMFFDTWAHIAENYSFYQYIYNFPGKLFRTDYCVSIAVHIMNGMIEGDLFNNFGGIPLINMLQQDDIVEVREDDWIFLVNNRTEEWKNILSSIKDSDIHCMNKRALDRHSADILEVKND